MVQTSAGAPAFFDSEKFMFIEAEAGHLEPCHYRKLGAKEGGTGLYAKEVSWADVTINEVPLEQTFVFEDQIAALDMEQMWCQMSDEGAGEQVSVTVNGRDKMVLEPYDDYPEHLSQKWLNRIDKVHLSPHNLPAAKKKSNNTKWPVKPKAKKIVRDEKIIISGEKLQELVDKKDHGVLGEHVFEVWNSQRTKFEKAKMTTFCPPVHWVEPTIQWDKIWAAMDEIEYGYKRNYHYVKPNEINKDGVRGPAIYFYDPDSDDINYNYQAHCDMLTANASMDDEIKDWNISEGACLSFNSYLERSKRAIFDCGSDLDSSGYTRAWFYINATNYQHCPGHGRLSELQAPYPHL